MDIESCRSDETVKTINIERLVPSPLTIERKTGGTHLSLLYILGTSSLGSA